MNLEFILSAISSGNYSSYNPETNPMQLVQTHSRGPAEDGRITTLSARLKPTLTQVTSSHVIFVIDKSGSMQGQNFDAAKRVFKTIFDCLADNTSISLLLFNHENQIITITLGGKTLSKFTKAQIKDTIDSILAQTRPGGTTDTVNALKATADLICQGRKPSRDEANNTSIVFITDGFDNRTHPQFTQGNPVMSGEQLVTFLRSELLNRYDEQCLPRIIPIGIGLNYMEQYLAAIGNSDDFHRTGFIHIAQSRDVTTQSSALQLTVDPIRVKTDLLVCFRDGKTKLIPWGFIQQSSDKSFLCDSTDIDKIYMINYLEGDTPEVIEIIDHVPSVDSLYYDDEILKNFLVAENARIHTLLQANIIPAHDLLTSIHADIRKILSLYHKAYWQKVPEALTALENLQKLYKKTDDMLCVRAPIRLISTTQTQTVAQHNMRDQLLGEASLFSRINSCATSPGTW